MKNKILLSACMFLSLSLTGCESQLYKYNIFADRDRNFSEQEYDSNNVKQIFPGETVKSDFVVVINTNMDSEAKNNTGTLVYYPSDSYKEESGADVNNLSVSNSIKYKNQINLSSNELEEYEPTTPYVVNETTYAKNTGTQVEEFKLYYEGQHCYVWMEKSLGDKYQAANYEISEICKQAGEAYDKNANSIVEELAGTSDIPYRDNTGKISIALCESSCKSGFYIEDDNKSFIYIVSDVELYEDQKDWWKYNEDDVFFDSITDLYVHEAQHVLYDLYVDGKGWTHSVANNNMFLPLNEGLSKLSMDYTNKKSYNGILEEDYFYENIPFLKNGHALLDREASNNNYDLTSLYLRYLSNQISADVNSKFLEVAPTLYKTFYSVSSRDKDMVTYMDEVVAKLNLKNNETFKQSMINFYLATVAKEDSGLYSFYNDKDFINMSSSYPLYTGESGKSTSLLGRSAIVLDLGDGTFSVPTDGDESIVYYAVNNKGIKANIIDEKIMAPLYIQEVHPVTNVDFKKGDIINLSDYTIQIVYTTGARSRRINIKEFKQKDIELTVYYSSGLSEKIEDVDNYVLKEDNCYIHARIRVSPFDYEFSNFLSIICYRLYESSGSDVFHKLDSIFSGHEDADILVCEIGEQ